MLGRELQREHAQRCAAVLGEIGPVELARLVGGCREVPFAAGFYSPRLLRTSSAARSMAAAQATVSFGFFPLAAFFAALSASASARLACLRSRRTLEGALPPACSTRCIARSKLFLMIGGIAWPAHGGLCRPASRRQRTVPQGTVVLVVATPGTVLVVAPGFVAVVVVVIAGPGAVVDVVLVAGAAHCDRSTIQPAQRAQSGVRGGIAVPASHTATASPPAIGHSQVSAQSAWTMPSPQYPVQLGRVEGGTKVEVVVVVVVVVIVGPAAERGVVVPGGARGPGAVRVGELDLRRVERVVERMVRADVAPVLVDRAVRIRSAGRARRSRGA